MSITVADILMSVNQKIRTEFPGMKVYGKEIKEGFERPSFFVEIIDEGLELHTKNVSLQKGKVGIFYFPAQKATKGYSESENLKMADKLIGLFSMVIKVKDRHLTVKESLMQYEDDIMQMTFSLEFYIRNRIKMPDAELMENVHLEEIKIKEEVE